MIKRRFYKFEHGDKDNASDSSSSSSDSEIEVEVSEESESESEQEVAAKVKQNDQTCSTSSGYESEDSSANDVGVDSAGLIDEDETEDNKEIFINKKLPTKHGAQLLGKNVHTLTKEPLPDDFPSCVLKCKSVFKCKLCPRIVCLNEETVRAHIHSKRHARSKKLLKEGRLKTLLNSDGETENQEIAAETHAPVPAVPQDKQNIKCRGRQRMVKGSKRKRLREENGSKRMRKKEG